MIFKLLLSIIILKNMECYICYDKETINNQFCKYQPCKCKGTTKIHENCLQKLKINCGNRCSICKSQYKENNQQKLLSFEEYVRKTKIENNYRNKILNTFENIYQDDAEMLAYVKQLSIFEDHNSKKQLLQNTNNDRSTCCSIS